MAISIIELNGSEHPNVQNIIQIAEEIISQNKPLTTENLYNIAKKRLKLSHRGLLSIIQYLFNKKILIEGSKYTKGSLLLNPNRKNVYNFIQNNLGAHFSLIRKEALLSEVTKGGVGQLIWHLEMLLKFKYIKKIKIQNFTLFLPIYVDDKLGMLYFILRDELYRNIIKLFIKSGQLKKSDIYKLLDKPREHIYYRLNNLIEYEILIASEQEPDELILRADQKELIKEILNKI